MPVAVMARPSWPRLRVNFPGSPTPTRPPLAAGEPPRRRNVRSTPSLRTAIGNQAGGLGGGIFNTAFGTARLFDTKVVKNIALTDGGGIYNDGGTVELNTATGTVVIKNRPNNCVDVPGCAG